MDKALRNTIIFCILVVSFSFSYYLVIFTPQNEANKLQVSEANNVRDNSGWGPLGGKCCGNK